MPVRKDSAKETLPILLGGIITSIGAGIPLLNIILCWAWALIGGAVASFIISKESKITPQDGAKNGALSGVAGAFILVITSFIVSELLGGFGFSLLGAYIPYPEIILGLSGLEREPDILIIIGRFILTLIIFPLFGALGGFLAAKFSRK